MRVAIHQPNFLPWMGYFHKMLSADMFVLLDDVQYTKGGFINRNAIKTSQGRRWLTVPVITKGRSLQRIIDVEIDNSSPWRKKMLATLSQEYHGAAFYEEHLAGLESVLDIEHSSLVDFNIQLIELVRACLRIVTPLCRSSSLENVEGTSTQRLISICKQLGATIYLSGAGGKKYQDDRLYEDAGIDVMYSNFVQPAYPQLWGKYEPKLSIVDLIFNVGEEAGRKLLEVGG